MFVIRTDSLCPGKYLYFQGFYDDKRDDFHIGGLSQAVQYEDIQSAGDDLDRVRYLDPYDENWRIADEVIPDE